MNRPCARLHLRDAVGGGIGPCRSGPQQANGAFAQAAYGIGFDRRVLARRSQRRGACLPHADRAIPARSDMQGTTVADDTEANIRTSLEPPR